MTSDIDYGLQEIESVAKRLLPRFLKHRYIALHGDLAAGKTSFTAAIGQALQLYDRVSSPTFSIINEYHYQRPSGETGKVFHMDWYRLEGESEAREAGVEATLSDPEADLIIIEWPEKAPGLLPVSTLHLYFENNASPDYRKLHLASKV